MIKRFHEFHLNESTGGKPQKRWPTEIKAVCLANLSNWLKEKHGIDIREVIEGERNSDFMREFIFEKCHEPVLFPKISERTDMGRRYEKFIFKESIFEIPETYNTGNDFADSIEKRAAFKAEMRELLKHKYKTDAEWDEYEKTLDKHVNFGADDLEWAVPVLKLIHDEFKEHYVNGKLRVWMPGDIDYDWKPKNEVPFRRPHEMDVVGNHVRKDGVYFYSDLAKYFKDKYGIDDAGFYEFIIENEYIEGRYWERIWSLPGEEKNPKKLKRKNAHYQKIKIKERGIDKTIKHGMDANENENVEHILNIIEKDFADDFIISEYSGPFEIFMDVKKPIKKWDDEDEEY